MAASGNLHPAGLDVRAGPRVGAEVRRARARRTLRRDPDRG
jgi:hypothetical protein